LSKNTFNRVLRSRRKKDGKMNCFGIKPSICLGQPPIRGMLIAVRLTFQMLASGKSIQEVLEAYSKVESQDLQQALKYTTWMSNLNPGENSQAHCFRCDKIERSKS